MLGLKKTLFGGYKRSSVDAAINEINQKVIDLQDDNLSLKRASDESASKITELEKKLAELSAENEKLKSENGNFRTENSRLQVENSKLNIENVILKAEQTENGNVFKNVQKIYKRAYGTGHDIVSESNDIARGMLNKVDDSFSENLSDAEEILSQYESVHGEIERMFESLSSEILSVRKNADAMLGKAKRFVGVYDEMKCILNAAKTKNDIIMSQYEADTAEFVDSFAAEEKNFSTAHKNFVPSDRADIRTTENAVSETEAASVKPAEAETPLGEKEENEEVVTSSVYGQRTFKIVTSPALRRAESEEQSGTSDTVYNDDAADETMEASADDVSGSAADVPAENTDAAAPVVIASVPSMLHNERQTEPAPETESVIGSESAVVAEPDARQRIVSEAKSESSEVKKTASNGEFSQFGRKSRVSNEDRNELLRKAL